LNDLNSNNIKQRIPTIAIGRRLEPLEVRTYPEPNSTEVKTKKIKIKQRMIE
jgi:hypothetical protein